MEEHEKTEKRYGAGYSGKPLAQKLGIKIGTRLAVVGQPAGYWDLIGTLPQGASIVGNEGSLDLVHLFVTSGDDLAKSLPVQKTRIAPNGMIWVSWPKRSSGVLTDLDESDIREVGSGCGLVDTKVCAVDETWSALKLVIRVRDR